MNINYNWEDLYWLNKILCILLMTCIFICIIPLIIVLIIMLIPIIVIQETYNFMKGK